MRSNHPHTDTNATNDSYIGAGTGFSPDTSPDKNAIQLEALQTLINSIGNGQLPTRQTLPLAQRILSSSIEQTKTTSSTTSSSHSSNLSSSLVKKIHRCYNKNISKYGSHGHDVIHSNEIQNAISNVQDLYHAFVIEQRTRTDRGERERGNHDVQIVNDTLKILCRLAGTGKGVRGSNQRGKSKAKANTIRNENTHLAMKPSTNENYLDLANNPNNLPKQKAQTHERNIPNSIANSSSNKPSNTIPDSHDDLRTFKHVQIALHDEEQAILRECIHALQFINGDLIRFDESSYIDHSSVKSNKWYDEKENLNVNNVNTDIEDDDEKNIIESQLKTIQIRNGLLPFHINPSIKVNHKATRLLSAGSLDALHICCEAGWLYSRIMNYIKFAHERKNNAGVIPRALASAFMNELQTYHSLLSSLEIQLLQKNKPLNNNKDGDDGSNGQQEKHKELTCRHLMIQLRSPISQLRTMAIMIDGIEKTLNGGQLLTALYLHSIHGDMRHVSLVNRILYSASLPWYDLLYDWCINGVLLSNSMPLPSSSMKKNEFFIQENSQSSSDNVWHGLFFLNKDQIPSLPSIGGGTGGLLTESLANEILIVGKGINFIRKCLHDSQWSLNVQKLIPQKELERFIDKMKNSSSSSIKNNDDLFHEIKKLLGFHYDCVSSRRLVRKDLSGQCGEIITQSPLERTVSSAAEQVHKHILTSLFEDHHLLQHLRGLKEILFLGQGDFICTLMDGLNIEFERCGGADGIYMHNMIGILHEAFRSTNAKFLPEFVLQRVCVKLLSPNERTSKKFWIDINENDTEDIDGWEIFSLGYQIQAPLTAVVHPTAMDKYHEVFNLLFRLKRIEWMLNSTWRQSTILNHALQNMESKYGDVAVGSGTLLVRNNEIARMKRLLRTFSMTRQMMLHFFTNFQSYMMFDVLENGWKTLVKQFRNAKTLDEIISAHDKYLDEIVMKSLLESLGRGKKKGGDGLGRQLRKVLTVAYRFCKAHEKIFGEAIQSIDKVREKRRGAESRSKAGKWGYDKVDPEVEGRSFYNLSDDEALQEILSISQHFDLSLRNLLSMLNEKVNGVMAETTLSSPLHSPPLVYKPEESIIQNDDSLRFLTFRLDFSDFYSP